MDPQPPDGPSDPDAPRPDLEQPADQPAPTEAPANEPAAPAAPRRRGLAIVIAAIAVVVLGAAGAAAFLMMGSDAKLMERVPASAGIAATVYLDPPAGQKVNLIRMLTEFPDVPDQEQLRSELDRLLDEALRDTGLTHEDLDWVGSQVAFYLTIDEGLDDPRGAFLIAVDDEEGASAALDTFADAAEDRGENVTVEERGGFDVYIAGDEGDGAAALVDGVMVFASGASAIDDVIATTEDGSTSLATLDLYEDTMAELPDEHLASTFVNVPELTSAIEQLEIFTGATTGQFGSEGATGLGATISAEPDGIAIDVFSGLDASSLTDDERATLESTHEITLTDLIPDSAVGFATQTGIDVSLEATAQALQEQDPAATAELEEFGVTGPGGLTEIIGPDLALMVSKGSSMLVDGAVMVTTTDPAAMQDLLDRWANEATATLTGTPLGEAAWREVTHGGVSFKVLDLAPRATFAYGVVDDVAVIALSDQAMRDIIDLSQGSGSSIDEDPTYQRAVDRVPSSDAVFFVDLEKVVAMAEEAGLPSEEIANLRPVVSFIVGSDGDLDGTRARLFVEIP